MASWMWWKSKPIPTAVPISQSTAATPNSPTAARQTQSDVGKALSDALAAYEREFYKRAQVPSSGEAEAAKVLVANAVKFVRDSRLGYALARMLFEHIRYWPSWSKRADFVKYCNGPFDFIDGTSEGKRCSVNFSYNSKPYSLKFSEHSGYAGLDDDPFYGQMEFSSGDTLVLGVDVSKGLGEFEYWQCFNVFALQPGAWMRDLIEMAAYIDAKNSNAATSFADSDAIKRAKNIKLPEE